jgi:ABC-type Fe3+-siderophore transport system permease subunit
MSDPLVEALPALMWAGVTATALCVAAVVLAGAVSFVGYLAGKAMHVGRRHA